MFLTDMAGRGAYRVGMPNDREVPEFSFGTSFEILSRAERAVERGRASVERSKRRIEESQLVLKISREMKTLSDVPRRIKRPEDAI